MFFFFVLAYDQLFISLFHCSYFSVKTQLLQCDLTVRFTHPDKVAYLHSGIDDPVGLTASTELAVKR